MRTPDQVMLDLMAGVAAAKAGREGCAVAIERNPAFWTVRDAAEETWAGWERVGVVEPGEDAVGLMKRIQTARMMGLQVPANVPRVDPVVVAREGANEAFICNRCNQPRTPDFHPCPVCLCPEYRIEAVPIGLPRATEACLPKSKVERRRIAEAEQPTLF